MSLVFDDPSGEAFSLLQEFGVIIGDGAEGSSERCSLFDEAIAEILVEGGDKVVSVDHVGLELRECIGCVSG